VGPGESDTAILTLVSYSFLTLGFACEVAALRGRCSSAALLARAWSQSLTGPNSLFLHDSKHMQPSPEEGVDLGGRSSQQAR